MRIGLVLVSIALLAAAARSGADESAREPRSLSIAGVSIRLELPQDDFRHGAAPILEWIERSVDTVAAYYGRFPTTQLRIRVLPVEGGGVRRGTAFPGSTPLIRLQVGRAVSAQELYEDWVLVHEMVHLALPEVGDERVWLAEGLATYVESVARVQAGHRVPSDVWSEYMRAMPQGLPQPGDRGLDHTHTWGRTYWGGAVFCLLADVEIRKRTDNRYGLQDALRALARASGGMVNEWPIDRALATADEAVGTTVLRDLYAQMKDAPVTPDLPALWRNLGIQRSGATIELDDEAPLAAVRKAIMRKPRS